MSGEEKPVAAAPSPEQLRYAGLLDYGVKVGLALLVAGLILYVGEVLPPLVPFEALPRLWALPAEGYVRESGMATGWGWVAFLHRGDVAALVGVALLAGISVPCLAMLVPVYRRNGDRSYLAIALALIGVLLLAASGLVVSH